MTISSIILSHYKEREGNLKRIVDDLLAGTVKPDKIIVFIDNPEINFSDERVTIIRSSSSFLPNIRFALGSVCDTDYCFFIDDDLSVRSRTLENFINYADTHPTAILGLEGSVLGEGETPYTNDKPIKRGNHPSAFSVDIIIRTYFVPRKSVMSGLYLQSIYSELPKKSLDDVLLCLGNIFLNLESNYVIPVDSESDLTELPDGGVGQERSGDHYKNRNEVCRKLLDIFKGKLPN